MKPQRSRHAGVERRGDDARKVHGQLRDRALLEHISANQLRSFRARYSANVAVDELLQIS